MPERYRTIVADPPWEHPDSGARTTSTAGNWRGKWLGYESKVPYERMTLEAIKALPVAQLAAADAHLYLGWDYWGDESLGTAELPHDGRCPLCGSFCDHAEGGSGPCSEEVAA